LLQEGIADETYESVQMACEGTIVRTQPIRHDQA
jgi:hypothetical protein